MASTPHPPSREQLLYWLHEAAEIEHHLMCCYLYAAFSLKRTDPHWSGAQRDAVERWRRTIMSVVFEEMTHLALVGNLAQALGASPHMNRPAFPVDAGPYPAGFVIRLQPFSAATIEHFKFLERPSHQRLADAAGFVPQREYRRAVPEGRLSPGPRDYDTVGELYEVLAQSLEACVAAFGEAALFVGDPALQVDATLAPLPGVVAVTDLASARQAIHTIVTQGEGAGSEEIDSHFCRFTRVGEELAALMAADPGFEPAWPAATNPVMNAPIHSANERVHISEPRIARWLDIGNALYTTSLRCLLQGFGARGRQAKATWLAASFALMRALMPVGQGLAARPASQAADGPNAGLTFTPLRTLAALPQEGAAAVVAERLGQSCQCSRWLGNPPTPGRASSRCWPRSRRRCCASQAPRRPCRRPHPRGRHRHQCRSRRQHPPGSRSHAAGRSPSSLKAGAASTRATACWTRPASSRPTRRASGSTPTACRWRRCWAWPTTARPGPSATSGTTAARRRMPRP